mgnify:FL=1|tara:strand:- start:107 stop:358 length:252 start_codon:yes stop_codon:yes gene_type:complete
MSIKHLLNSDMVDKWKKEEDELFGAFKFSVGDLVSRTDSLGESLGIFIEQDGVWAKVCWTKMPEGVIFREKQMVSDLVILKGE